MIVDDNGRPLSRDEVACLRSFERPMDALEYRQDDVLGVGYCPRCHRAITIDTALHGVCTVHGKVPADFARPTGWTDPAEEEEYNGTDYFWAYEYRYPMRDLSPSGRRRVHAKMLARGLDPVGVSDAHKQAITDALWERDRARLRRYYGTVAWAWWDR